MKHTRLTATTVAVTAILASATLAGCGSSSGSKASSGASMTAQAGSGASPTMASSSANQASMPFGPACSKVPSTGPGSVKGMTKDPVATAAGNNPLLSTLVTAVKKAGLVDTLNSAKAITVFAPDNAAFAKIKKSDLTALLNNKQKLTSLLEYHVLPTRVGPDKLAGTHKTLNGKTLKVTGSGTSFTVNGTSHVICGNVQTANATVYVVDTVLMPSGS